MKTLDRRVRHFTHENVRRMLSRSGVESARISAPDGTTEIRVAAHDPPATRQLLNALSFSKSLSHGYYYRVWRAGV